MPAGKTHDRITLWLTPWVGLGTMIITHHWGYTGLVVGSFIFAGAMFGPDLDIHSVQSKRWGWLRWLWQPYRRSLKHRSWLSHGFLAGTLLRLLYLFGWILFALLIGLEVTNTSGHTHITWNDLGSTIARLLTDYWRIWAAIAIGIELGAMSHYLADHWVSAWKREQRQATGKQPRVTARRDRRKRRKKSRR